MDRQMLPFHSKISRLVVLCLLLLSLRFSLATTTELQVTVEGDDNNDNHPLWKTTYDEQELQDLTLLDLWYILECKDLFSAGPRPIYPLATWQAARNRYEALVGTAASSLVHDPEKTNGFQVPIFAQQKKYKGRGIVCSSDIPEGTLIWSADKSARFQDANDYRKFLLTSERGFACDVMQWAYVQDLGSSSEERKLHITVDLDEGSFCNDGFATKANMGCHPEASKKYPGGGCKTNYFALRDIQAGEELLCEYSSFAIPYGWDEFGL